MQAFAKADTLNVRQFTLPPSSEFAAAMLNCNAHLIAIPTQHGLVWSISVNGAQSRRVDFGEYVAFPTRPESNHKLAVGTIDHLTEEHTFLD